jgi:NCAIR mutase (PurE)-related protein
VSGAERRATNAAPFADLRAALTASDISQEDTSDGRTIRPDPNRKHRTGIPEVIFAESKSPDVVVSALRTQADATARAVASRCSGETRALVRASLGEPYRITDDPIAQTIVVSVGEGQIEPTGGRIGVIAAGTSDLPWAREAALIAREMGVEVTEIADVGVAGLHRLVGPLERLLKEGVDAIVVAAGMDGALPSVVAGLVDVPVIGLPTSVGYGFGGGGVGALTTMLQSCAPGLAVVNIDNGIGAGSMAALIANRAACHRSCSAR